MSDLYILDSDGEPVPESDTLTWGRWFETAERTLAKTEIGGATVSTIFLGLDHSYGDGPVLLWETLVLGGPLADEMEQYATKSQALAGHEAMVRRCTEAEGGVM